MKFASKSDENKFNKLENIRSKYEARLIIIEKEQSEILRKAKWTLEEVMRREG